MGIYRVIRQVSRFHAPSGLRFVDIHDCGEFNTWDNNPNDFFAFFTGRPPKFSDEYVAEGGDTLIVDARCSIVEGRIVYPLEEGEDGPDDSPEESDTVERWR